eukprot:g7859.t1
MMYSFRIDEVAYRLVSSKWFDRVIIATIVVNCSFLALNDPTKLSTQQDALLIVGDYIFSAIFIAELLAKWLALSIPTYFKDNWNWVDFIVVLESVTSLLLKAFRSTSALDISALRALRVLRPLRAITYIPQVKLLFETVISAFKVVNTLLLCVGVVILFFGNVGYTYWADAFRYTCEDAVTFEVLSEDLVCGKGYTCPDGFVCANSGQVAINHGLTGYHNIWHAMLQVFQVVSLDGWQQVMWHTQDAAGEETWAFFVVVLVVGNVILVSMFPAVLSSKLEAAIGHEDRCKRNNEVQAEQDKGEVAGAEEGDRASEFEMLLNEYSKIDADEIKAIERMAAVRRGEIREEPEEEEPLPPWTPFPANATLNRLRKAVVAELGPFSIFVYVVIFLNALVLCLDSATASERTERVLSAFNEAFTSLFVVEMAIKMGLLGPVGYFNDGYNIFDFTITLLGLIEITIQVDMGRMVSIILTTIPWVVNIYAVQLLLMYTFTVLGMQFFGGDLQDFEADSDNSIRFNYNSFGKAAVTLLDLLTGNIWDELMFDTVEATSQETGIIFYVTWLVLSRWLTVAMVVIVLFNRIDVDTENYLKIAAKTSMHSVFALEHAFMQCHKSYAFLVWRKRYEEATAHLSSTKGQMKLLEYHPPPAQPGLWQKIKTSDKSLLLFGPQNRIREFCRWLTNPTPITASNTQSGEPKNDTGSIARLALPRAAGNASGDLSVRGNQGCWRRFLGRQRPHRLARVAFQAVEVCAVVAILVVVSVDVELASGRRMAADGKTGALHLLEMAAVSAFLVGALLHIVAQGLVLLPGAYLRGSSDILAFLLTALSTVCLWPFGNGERAGDLPLSAVKALRALNILRLVWVAKLSCSLMDLLKALRSSGRALCLAGAVVLACWIQWAIVGLQVWGGTFNFCSDPATAEAHGVTSFFVYRTEENGIEGQSECEAAGFEWKNAKWNFDHIGNALQSVLVIFTYNGWQGIMFHAINARVSAGGLNAEAWNNTWAAVFFLCVILISLVLVLLLVGVVFSMYTFINLTKRSGRRLSSLKQAFWTVYETKLAEVQPDTVPACPADAPRLRRLLFDAASSPRWNVALAFLVGANVIARFLIGSADWMHYSDAPAWVHSQEAAFAAVLVFEWACRAVAFGGVRAITRSHFQVADALATLVLALVFIEEIIFLVSPASSHAPFWKAVEAVSVVRLVRLGHVLPNAQEFLLVTAKSSSVVFPLLLVLVSLTYLWSVCGVVFFGSEAYLGGLFGEGNAYETENRHQGFFGVAQGMQTMIGVATTPCSNGWMSLMRSYEDVTPPRWRWAVVVFFGSYAFLTRFLLVQFFMITLLFKYKAHSSEKVGVAIEQVNQFKHAWMRHAYRYTKEYTSIFAGQLVDFLKELPPPLGVGAGGSYYDCQILAKKVLFAMGIDDVTHVPAEDMADVMPLFADASKHSSLKPQVLGSGPGLIRLNFSKVLVAVHRIVLFDLTLEDERQVNERRKKARSNLSVLRLGVHRFLAMRAKRATAVTRAQLEGVALAECSLLRTQLPSTFRARSLIALTAEFLRWRDHVDLRGYDHEAHMQGQCLLKAASHEIAAAAALEQLTSRLCESRVGDRKLVARLVEVRQHVVTLRELRIKLDTARGDYLRTTWDGASLRVRQTIEDGERSPGITGVCGSVDGTWVFCATDNGLIKVFKRGKARRPKRNKKSYQQVYVVRADKKDSLTVLARFPGQAMKAEGIRGRKPTVLYRLTSVGKGHKAAVSCMACLEPGYFYTGGEDGVVSMWHMGAGKRPIQAVDVCRSMLSSNTVRCLTIWRTTYSIDLLAACLDVDDNQELEPPVYLLAGDEGGYLSVLPARHDSKFFAVDVWKASLKHQADTAAVTAIEVAWGRVYSASGLSGVVKAWTPLWEDEAKEKLLGFSQAGQYSVHSGVVSSIVYTKGLMFSAGSDLSIVTWYPPRQDAASAALLLPHTAQGATASPLPPPHDTEAEERRRTHSDSTAEPSPAVLPPPSPSASPAQAAAVGDEARAWVTHEIDPGVVVHVAGVVGMAVVPGGLVSADVEGRLLERGPERLIESHSTQMLPGEEVIQRLRPLALEVLRARAHTKPGGAAAAAGAAALAPQASSDHVCAVRFLLRAKAKRRLKEEILAENKREADLKTATVFAARLGHQQGANGSLARPMLGAKRTPRGSTSSNRSSASETATRARRRTMLSSVSVPDVGGRDGGGMSQETADVANDVTKIAGMDQKPAFLEAADLERLAKHPEVYLAELITHFFPGRDLAPQRPSGSGEASTLTRATRERITRSSAGGGAKRVPLLDRVKAKSRSAAKGIPALGGGWRNANVPGAVSNFSSTMEAVRRSAAILDVRKRSSDAPPCSSGARGDGGEDGEEGPIGLQLPSREMSGGELAPTEFGLLDTPLTRRGSITPTFNLGALLQRATREQGEKNEAEGVAQEPEAPSGDGPEGEQDKEGNRAGQEKFQPIIPPASQSRTHHLEDAGHKRTGATNLPMTVPGLSKSLKQPAPLWPSSGDRHRQPLDSGRCGETTAPAEARGEAKASDIEDTSFVGDNFSTIQLRQQGGTVTVYVPRSPHPGVWAASVAYDGERDVAWVLTEALRMYGTEHDPVTRHAGLARRPRLVRRQPAGWGALFRADSKEWEPTVALPTESPVLSVLTPGEELVVLVDGWRPDLAFTRRPSTTALPPRRADDRVAGHPDDSEAAGGGARGHRVVGVTPTFGGDGRGAWRAPSDGARRFAGEVEAERNAGRDLVRLPAGKTNPGSSYIGVGPMGGLESGTVETNERRRTDEIEYPDIAGDYDEAGGDEKDCGDSDGWGSDSSLTEEEDEEEEEEKGKHRHYRNPLYQQGGTSRRSGGQETTTNDVSVTTKGLDQSMAKVRGSSLIVCFLLTSATIQVSAFAPWSLPPHRFDPATASTPASSPRHSTANSNKTRVRHRPQTTVLYAAAATSPQSPAPSESTSEAERGDGAGGQDPAPPAGDPAAPIPLAAAAAAAGAPSYRRLYDSAMRLLESELELEPYQIPAGLEGNSAVVGKGRNQQTVKTSITAFRSGKFRQIRAALVETDGLTQVLNLVMFPHPRYDLPIFGADLVSLPGVHLVCIDLQPAHPSQELGEEAEELMREAKRRHLDGLPWGGDLPEAARKFFSPHCLWAKLDPKEVVEQKALDAMMDYLRVYLRLAEEAEPLEGDGPLREVAAGHAAYSNYRRENDPARGMLTRFYGTEWAEAAIEGILFDFNGPSLLSCFLIRPFWLSPIRLVLLAMTHKTTSFLALCAGPLLAAVGVSAFTSEELQACEANTFMCCWTGNKNGMPKTMDVCRVNNYPGVGDVLEMPRDDEGPVYCHGMTWEDHQDFDAEFMPVYDYLMSLADEGGFHGHVKGAPECGCVEDMPVVTNADCSRLRRGEIEECDQNSLFVEYKRGAGNNEPLGINLVNECDNWDVPEFDFRTCQENTYMCCWTENDGEGMQDNTDVCRVGDTLYPDESEGEVHCHGMVWPEDATDQYIHVVAQFVQHFDHRDRRGYYGSLKDAPMCDCIENMPVVTRADCSYPNPNRKHNIAPCPRNNLQYYYEQLYGEFPEFNLVKDCDNDVYTAGDATGMAEEEESVYEEKADGEPVYEQSEYKETDEYEEAMTPTGNYKYLGCFKDKKKNRVLGTYMTDNSLTTEKCYDHCANEGAALMGTQYGKECWCAMDVEVEYDRHGEAECDTACAGNSVRH